MPTPGDEVVFKAVFYDLDGVIRTNVTVTLDEIRKPDGTVIDPEPSVSQVGNWYQVTVEGEDNDAQGEWIATLVATNDGNVTPLNAPVSVWVEAAGGGGGSAEAFFETDPADYDADPDSFAARFLAVKAKTDGIGATVEYTGAVATTGRVTVYQGKDYAAADGTALTWHSTSALDLDGADVTLDVNGESFAGSISGEAGDWTISVDLTATETTALPVFVHGYELSVELANGRTPPPLAFGSLQVIGER